MHYLSSPDKSSKINNRIIFFRRNVDNCPFIRASNKSVDDFKNGQFPNLFNQPPQWPILAVKQRLILI